MNDTTQQEPSMEEILASIRRIISEEGDGKSAAVPARSASPPAPRASDEDILELTQTARPPLAPQSAPPQAYSAQHPAPGTPPPAPAAAAQTPMREQRRPSPSSGHDELLSASSASAASVAFAQLSGGGVEESVMATLPLGGGRTVEDMVREMLRPLLKAWLDQNLPPLVERMVRAEIERLSRRG